MLGKTIKMGKLDSGWKTGEAHNISFGVTEACNLACKYCYMVGKNNDNKMTFEIAKKSIDYILRDREHFNRDSVVWDFIGGEPFLEMGLIDQIADYIKQETYLLKHPWFNSYRISFSTNGLLYDTEEVQKFIHKNSKHISIGVSVDGNKVKHDAQRVKLDGSGSYDDVVKVVPLWQKQFPNATTKATFSSDDIIHLKDSIIALWDMGIRNVAANVVFEDVWKDEDSLVYEEQLKKLADYVIEKELWNTYSVRFFDPEIGYPLLKDDIYLNYCGAGKMLSIDYKGDFFPCIRFTDFTLQNTKGLKIGDYNNGINKDLLRPFSALTLKAQSTSKCIECPVATGCAWCTGFNYDDNAGETIFNRATYNCEMYKANIRANEYFWSKLSDVLNIENPREIKRKERMNLDAKEKYKSMLFITHDNLTPHCNYTNQRKTKRVMDEKTFEYGIEYCAKNGFDPVLLGEKFESENSYLRLVDNRKSDGYKENILIFKDFFEVHNVNENNLMLVNKENLGHLAKCVSTIAAYDNCKRINVEINDLEKWQESDKDKYRKQLELIGDLAFNRYLQNNPIEISVLTDLCDLEEMCNCNCGLDSLTLAPNGKLYLCPAFYFDSESNYIGDLENGVNIEREDMLSVENAYFCSECDVYHCKRCLFLNKKLTREINTPSKIQCQVSHIEREVSRSLQNKLIKSDLIDPINYINKIQYDDPLIKIEKGLY